MGKCPGPSRCTCTIIAGPGITIEGSGSPTDPTVISSDAGQPLECEQVRGCFSAGDGAGYDPATGVITARPSTDSGNTLSIGTDGGLLVPGGAAEPLTVGCGLQGAGTAEVPLAAFPIAGERPWADDWDCTDAEHSTLRCDPGTGALWTPPEHTSLALTLQQNHPMSSPTFGPTGGFVLADANAWSQGTFPADALSPCRGQAVQARFTGHAEVTWTAGSVFDLAYVVQIDGGALAARLMHSRLQASVPAGHERWTFSTAQAAVLAPHTAYAVRVYPAINVTSGSVTINQWITDTQLSAATT